tara:strand:- start:397 stop:828 length:432 start_codon:yes stop_codon:yes gene_type:complete
MSELNEDNNNYDDCIFNMTKTETETNLNSIIVDENDEHEENKENKNSKKDNVILTKCDNISKSIDKNKKKKTKKKKKVRCLVCRKKLSIVTKFTCPDCSVITCATHRYATEHNCCMADDRYNKKRKLLFDSLPEIIPDKLFKI